MRHIPTVVLLLVAVIHLLPAFGALGAGRLQSLYGIPVHEANLEILLRHRAVLFGVLAAALSFGAFRSDLHGLALIGGLLSVGSFLILTLVVGGPNTALQRVFWVDVVAAILLIGGLIVHSIVRPDGSSTGGTS